MRIDIDGSGYRDATHHLNDANQIALSDYTRLTHTLTTTTAAMAGSDSTAAPFAAAYDPAAQTLTNAYTHLVNAHATLGLALSTTLTNHTTAEHDAHLTHPDNPPGNPGNPLGPITVTDPHYTDGIYYNAPTTTLPTSLGADTLTLPDWATFVLDHIQGFTWPDADATRLHHAADTWRQGATDLDQLTHTHAQARAALTHEHSPETPLAQAQLLDLEHTTYQLARTMSTLATTCDTYADDVTHHRNAILDLVHDLLRDTVIFETVGALFDLITGPAGTALATSAAIARISDKAPAILDILRTIRSLAETAATTLTTLTDTTTQLTTRLIRLTRLDTLRMTSLGMTAMLPEDIAKAWLKRWEKLGGHTIAKHIGRTDAQLMSRFVTESDLTLSSTFLDAAAARRSIETVIAGSKPEILKWLKTQSRQRVLRGPAGPNVGRCLDRLGHVHVPTRVRVILVRAPGTPEGYRVHTAFPDM